MSRQYKIWKGQTLFRFDQLHKYSLGVWLYLERETSFVCVKGTVSLNSSLKGLYVQIQV